MTCDFTTPQTFTGEAPSTSTDFWQYSQINCSSTQTELIENASTGADFFLKKSITYGDFIIITFLIIFLVFIISKFFIDLLIPKRINFKR